MYFHYSRQSGLTLIEAMIVSAVLALMVGIGLPSYRELRQGMQLRSLAHQLTTDFAAARMHAIRSGVPVVVCPVRGEGCRMDGDWSGGWMVFRDADRNLHPDHQDDVLSQYRVRTADMRILSNAGRPVLRYLPNGMSAGSNLTVALCSHQQMRARVVVNNGGRIRSEWQQEAAICP